MFVYLLLNLILLNEIFSMQLDEMPLLLLLDNANHAVDSQVWNSIVIIDLTGTSNLTVNVKSDGYNTGEK